MYDMGSIVLPVASFFFWGDSSSQARTGASPGGEGKNQSELFPKRVLEVGRELSAGFPDAGLRARCIPAIPPELFGGLRMTRVWSRSRVWLTVFAIGAWSQRAHAQGPAQAAFPDTSPTRAPASTSAPVPAPVPAPIPGATPPDMVLLKNGGMLRGTISESVPGASVTLMLPNGETRQLAFADVSYAGPASGAPKPTATAVAPPAAAPSSNETANGEPRPFAVIHAAEARLSFVSTPAKSTLFRRNATANYSGDHSHKFSATGYDEVCSAPCNVSIPAGTYTFAVGKSGDDPIELNPLTIPAGVSTLKSSLVDKSGTRTAVGVASGVAFILGTALIVVPSLAQSRPTLTPVLIGGALVIGGAFGLLSIGSFDDEVQLTLTPGTERATLLPASSRLASDARADAGSVRDQLSGLTLGVSF